MANRNNTPTPILQPPTPAIFDDKNAFFKLLYELWSRAGGYEAVNIDIKGLKATVSELNTLIGINVNDTVQQQLNARVKASALGGMAYQEANNVAITGGTISNVTYSGVTFDAITINNSTINQSNLNFCIFSSVNIQSGSISGTHITIPTGSALVAKTGGVLFSNYQTAGNVGGAEQSLLNEVILANTFQDDGQTMEIEAYGTVAANGNNKRIKLVIGTTTVLDTGSVAANSGSWSISAILTKSEANKFKCIAKILSDNSLIIQKAIYTLVTQDMAVNFEVKCVAQGSSDNDIVQEGLIIKYSAA